MTLYYESSDGTIIDFLSGDLSAQKPEKLAENSWEYTSISSVNGGHIKKFYKDVQEAKLDVEVFADTKEEFNATMQRMHRTFDRDIKRMTPGRLWWNEYYKEVFAVENSYDDFEELFESVQKTITFVSVYPYWIKTTGYKFFPGQEEEEEPTGYDYPHDYMFDYGISNLSNLLENTALEEANFRLIFYGPCYNPYITIGDNTYRLMATLAQGERAVIDSRTKKITQYSAIGEETNIFHLRDRANYIFTKIPEGTMPVTKPATLSVEIVLYDERGEPDWI